MKAIISFILTKLLFSASLSALVETAKRKEFPLINLIGKDVYSTALSNYIAGNNKYTITPATAGVEITPMLVDIKDTKSHGGILNGCVPSAPVTTETQVFICDKARLQQAKITFDEVTKKAKWEKVEDPVDLVALLKAKKPETPSLGQTPTTDTSTYKCTSLVSNIKDSDRDYYLLSCYRTNGDKESIVHAIYDIKKKVLLKRFDFENKADSKTSKIFTPQIVVSTEGIKILAVYDTMPKSSGVVKLYTVSSTGAPDITNEKIVKLSTITGVDPAFVLSHVSWVQTTDPTSKSSVKDLVFSGTKPGAMLIYSLKFKKEDMAALTLRYTFTTALASASYGPTFGATVTFNSNNVEFIGKNAMKTLTLKDDGTLKLDEKKTKETGMEIYYSCSLSTKANEVFTRSMFAGKGVRGIAHFTEDGGSKTQGITLLSVFHKEVQCLGQMKSDFLLLRQRSDRERYGLKTTVPILFTSTGNTYISWEVRERHTLKIDASKLTDGKKTLKLKVESQKATGGPAAIEFEIKLGKYKDIASSEAVISIPAKNVNIFPGELIKIPVGARNAYGNNLKFKVEAKGAKAVIVEYNNKKTLTIPKSGTTAITGKFNSFVPIGNDYFMQSQMVNFKTSTHYIYQCNVLRTTEDKVTCKFVKKFTLAKELILRKAFVVKEKILLIAIRTDISRHYLFSSDLAKLPTTEINKDVSNRELQEVLKEDADLVHFKLLMEKSDQFLMWWSYTHKYSTSSRSRGANYIVRYKIDYKSDGTGTISETKLSNDDLKYGISYYDFAWTNTIYENQGKTNLNFVGVVKKYEEDKGTTLKKGTYIPGKFDITEIDSLGVRSGKNRMICGVGKYIAVLDTRTLSLSGQDSSIGSERTIINFPFTVPGGVATDKITRIVQSECVQGSNMFQILATNYNQDKKFLFNFRVSDVVNGLKKAHSVIQLSKEVKYFSSYTKAFSGKVITTMIEDKATETAARDIYVFTSNGPDVTINTEGMTQNEIEVSIKAEGKTPEGKFKIKKVDEVTEVKVTSTATKEKFPTFKKGETVIIDDWTKIVGPVVDITVDIPADLKTKVAYNSRKSKKYGWKIDGVTQLKKVYTKGDLMFGHDGEKIEVIYKPAEFSEKFKDKSIRIKPSSTSVDDFIACSMDKSSHFVAYSNKNDIQVVLVTIETTSAGVATVKQKDEVEFKMSQDVQESFIVASDKNSFTYVEIFNEDKNIIRVRNWKRRTYSYYKTPNFDEYITPNSQAQTVDVFDLKGENIMILYGNNQIDTLSAMIVNKTERGDKNYPLYKQTTRFDNLQFLDDKEYGLPEHLNCDIKEKPPTLRQIPVSSSSSSSSSSSTPKPTPTPTPSVVYTHTLTCFVDIVGAKDFYYTYKINSKAKIGEKLFTEIKKITSVQNMKGFKILKAVATEKYTALLMERLVEPAKPAPKPAPTDNLKMFRSVDSLSQKPQPKPKPTPTPTPTPTPAKTTPINKCPKIITIYSPGALYPFAIITCDDLGLAEGSKDTVDISMDDYAGNYLYITTPPAKAKARRRILADGPSVNAFSISKASLTIKADNVPLDKIKVTYKATSGKNPVMKATDYQKAAPNPDDKNGGISFMMILIILVIILIIVVVCFVLAKKKGGDQSEGSVILNAKSGENYSSAPDDMDDSRL